jgi:hypothetical protein
MRNQQTHTEWLLRKRLKTSGWRVHLALGQGIRKEMHSTGRSRKKTKSEGELCRKSGRPNKKQTSRKSLSKRQSGRQKSEKRTDFAGGKKTEYEGKEAHQKRVGNAGAGVRTIILEIAEVQNAGFPLRHADVGQGRGRQSQGRKFLELAAVVAVVVAAQFVVVAVVVLLRCL